MSDIPLTMIEGFDGVRAIKNRIEDHDKAHLLAWCFDCLEPLMNEFELDTEVTAIVDRVREYKTQPIPVQEGRKLALAVHRVARDQDDLAERYLYRAIGHTVATIHVPSHAYGMVLYSLKSYHQLGRSVVQLEELSREYKKRLG